MTHSSRPASSQSFLSGYSLEDMWLFLVAVMLVILVVGR